MGYPGYLATGVSARLTVALVAAVLIPLCFAGCRRPEPVTPPSATATESANAPVGILGVSALEMSSNSITITKATTGAGSGMMLLVDGRGANEATLSIGDAFLLSDGRHASQFYRLIGIEPGWAVFRVTERFNAVPFGGGIGEATQTLRLASYSRE